MKTNYSFTQLKQFISNSNIEEGSKIPIYTSIIADTETPISLYQKFKKKEKYSFLLESAEQAEKMGRYSFIGFSPFKRIIFENGKATILKDKHKKLVKSQDPLKIMEEELAVENFISDPNLPRFQGGWVGYISYDCVKYFDGITLPQKSKLKSPEMEFILPEVVLIHDNQQRRLYVLTYLEVNSNLKQNYNQALERLKKLLETIKKPTNNKLIEPIQRKELKHRKDSKNYLKSVKTALKKIHKGEIFQVVLSEQFIKKTSQSSLEIYRKMRDINPSPYMYLLDFDETSIIGSSPETLVQVENKKVMVRPIAGTRRRGADYKEDKALAKDLLADKKERAEHQMLVDLARNDVGRVAKKGRVFVKNFMKIQKYSHVMHIVSDVYGRLDPSKSIFDAFKACFPAGTLSGAPKIRAMQIISELENSRRGIYGGAVGYFDFSGNMDFAIAIRTVIKKGQTVCAQAGAGIVFDSIPENEFQECVNKASSSLSTINQ